MKTLLTIIAVLALSTTTFAHEGKHPRRARKMGVTAVGGAKAKAIFEALDAEVVTRNRPKASLDVKKVGTLRCAKITKKADSSVKFRCALKGKKVKPGMRRGQRRGQGQQSLSL